MLHFVDIQSSFVKLVTRKKLWVHFIGDSDTRGLVLGLLRFLYAPLQEARSREDFARAYDGDQNGDLARLKHIDYQFALKDGTFQSQKHYGSLGHSKDKDKKDLLDNVYDYHLRISFGNEGPDGEFVKALKYWNDDHNGSFPDVVYMNLGAWFGHGETNSTTISDVTTLVERLMKKYESSKFVYGSVLFFRDRASNTFDTAMYKMALLKRYEVAQSRLHLFDRATFSRLMFAELNLEMDSSHAPLILNLFDAQRLAQLILSIFQVPIVKPYIPHSFNNCSIKVEKQEFIGTWNQHCEWFGETARAHQR